MFLATQTETPGKLFGDKKAIEMIARAGFDAIDYTMWALDTENPDCPLSDGRWEEHVKLLLRTAGDNGVVFTQAHAPFPSFNEDATAEANDKRRRCVIRSIEVAGAIGAKQIVVHPILASENQKQTNLDFYNGLVPYARSAGVKIALENMFTRNREFGKLVPAVCGTGRELAEYYDCLDSRYFTVCLDTGHAGLCGETADEMIRTLGHSRLGALHIHDNNGFEDMHTLPFTRNIAWDRVIAALRDVGYRGEFTFEADCFLGKMPHELYGSALTFMHDVGRYFLKQLEN